MNPYIFILIFVAVLALAIFVWYQAIKASQRSGKIRREMLAKMDRFNALSNRYQTLIKDELGAMDNADLFDVAVIRIWKKLGTAEEEMANFEALSSEEKQIYTAWYIREEVANDGFASYFRNCVTLKELSVNVLETLGLSTLDSIVKRACEMFDENSSVSCDKQSIAVIDSEFKAAYNFDEYCAAAANYIRANSDFFVDGDDALVEMGEVDGENE
ncbi:MAG: DUF4375 domain-containing protein [Clostridia bacterium]|nr:DUF4375 domain-containing protein [Clostridia bacterium]